MAGLQDNLSLWTDSINCWSATECASNSYLIWSYFEQTYLSLKQDTLIDSNKTATYTYNAIHVNIATSHTHTMWFIWPLLFHIHIQCDLCEHYYFAKFACTFNAIRVNIAIWHTHLMWFTQTLLRHIHIQCDSYQHYYFTWTFNVIHVNIAISNTHPVWFMETL